MDNEKQIDELAKNVVLLLAKFDELFRRDAQKARQENDKKYLNMAEAAKYTGFSISRMRDFIDQGKLQSCKPGGNKIMFKFEWLDDLFN